MLKERRKSSIGSAAAEPGCSRRRLQLAGRPGAIPPARRDCNGRLCSEFDIVLLKDIGIGCSRPRKFKRAEEVLGAGA